MNPETKTEFLSLLNRYPSPHNGQPMVLEQKDEATFDISFETDRGLSATPISYLFSFVTVGVFFRYLELCAKACGMAIKLDVNLPKVDGMAASDKLSCGSFQVVGSSEPDRQLKDVLLFRQTSRKKYFEGLNEAEIREFASMYSDQAIRLEFLNTLAGKQAVWLNQRAVFDDMFDDKVRRELRHWMRFDAAEKSAKQDGLAYDCMELSSGSLKFVFKYYKILHWPVIRTVLKRYYLRTMQDESTVGYITAPFQTEEDAFSIGKRVLDIWIELSKRKRYLHPFGTIVSNGAAHQDFRKLVGLSTEGQDSNYIVFIFRAGSSEAPVKSERLDVTEHILKGETV